ncbi:MAG: N-acetyl sugar amidotransferase, partial [Candidatus Margulisbacteria bacterium]|nr:N-acetyl sugar amidotransferase [Candidatus Margulisiibacteriota bacterium]
YDKNKAKELLIDKLGWKDYGGKHGESRITRFYQEYILPVKFGIDKRRAFLSSLIFAGQISRSEALEQLKEQIGSPERCREDKEYFLKKLGLSAAEFEGIMSLPIKLHHDYPAYDLWHKRLTGFLRQLKRRFITRSVA